MQPCRTINTASIYWSITQSYQQIFEIIRVWFKICRVVIVSTWPAKVRWLAQVDSLHPNGASGSESLSVSWHHFMCKSGSLSWVCWWAVCSAALQQKYTQMSPGQSTHTLGEMTLVSAWVFLSCTPFFIVFSDIWFFSAGGCGLTSLDFPMLNVWAQRVKRDTHILLHGRITERRGHSFHPLSLSH